MQILTRIIRYPVFPWVVLDFTSDTLGTLNSLLLHLIIICLYNLIVLLILIILDLTNPTSFRDLSKPMGALNPQRLATFKVQILLIK